MVWMPFKGRKQASLWEVLFFFSIIPNFCLGSQPSGIPLILHGLLSVFNPLRHLISSFIIIYFLFRYGYKRGFGCFNLLLCPLARTFLGILETKVHYLVLKF